LTRKAEAAILRLNPNLHELRNVLEGTPVLVPDLPGAGHGETEPLRVEAELVPLLREALNMARAISESSIKQRAEEAKTTVETVKSPEVIKLASTDEELEKTLTRIEDEMQARLKTLTTLKATRKEELSQLQKDLEAFVKAIS